MSISQIAQKNHDELFPNHGSVLAITDPEFIEIFDNFTFDEVLKYISLGVKLRMKITLASLIAMQCVNEYKAMMNGALNVGVSPIEIREIVYQAVPYAGLGKVFDFLQATNDVLAERGITLPLEKRGTTTVENRYEKGLEIVREVAGEAVDQMLATMPKNQKHFATFLADNCFGDYFTRDGLTSKERELLIFTMLASMGGVEAQLKGHIRNNQRIGNDKQKLIETITVLLPFIGYPRTLTALNCINEVLPEKKKDKRGEKKMNYVKFGNTGMDVSRICLGAMGFGDPNSGFHEWVLEEKESKKVIKKALDLGINFFDTANVYSFGASERILGKALNEYANRDEIVVATKLFVTMKRDVPNSGGLSRKEIFHQIDASLERLGMDYVDLYIIHRWDYNTPIEETMEALHDVVKSGKVRYIGASAMFAWQFAKAQAVAEKNGWTKFVSMQNHLNLLYREEEREMLPLCEDQKIAVTPYSPLASGRLTRDWSAQTKRFETDKIAMSKYDTTADQDRIIVERVAEIAEKRGVERVQVALAWLLQKGPVVAPIIGATKESHLTSAIPALDLILTEEEVQFLEEPYVPHVIVGHQ